MLIAFSGAQSTGKSTLLRECKKLNQFKDYTFVTEVTRRIKRDNNAEINNMADNYDYTQSLIMADHVRNSTLTNAILDRCFIDGFIYTAYLHAKGKVSNDVFENARSVYYDGFANYDIIFYTDSGIPLVNDGVRSIDMKFRNDIIGMFEEEISEMNMFAGIPIVRVKGTVEQRIDIIKNWLQKIKK